MWRNDTHMVVKGNILHIGLQPRMARKHPQSCPQRLLILTIIWQNNGMHYLSWLTLLYGQYVGTQRIRIEREFDRGKNGLSACKGEV